MAKIYCKSSYLLRRDTAENWQNKNPILRKGEQGLETDTGIIKIGDGVTAFNSLSDDNIYLPKRYANSTFANALKGNASGSAILIDDVSPVTHEMGVKVNSKNLIPYPYAETQSTIYGITVTYGEDGSVIFNGTATSNVYFKVFERMKLPAGKYYLSGTPTEGGAKVAFLYFFETDNPNTVYNAYTTNGVSCSLSGTEYSGRIYIAKGITVENLVFKPQLELGTTATAYTPYVDLTAVKVSRYGKNLLSEMSLFPTVTNNAVPIHFKAGQKYTISFKTTYTTWRLMFFGTDKNGTAFDNSKPDANKYISEMYTGTTGRLQHASNQSGNTLTFTCNEDCIITAIVFWNVANETNKTYSDFQLEIGSTATDYEPYKECAEYTPTSDGIVESVTSLYPNTTLMTDTGGVIIDCEYNRDINKAFAELQQAIISLGGNV